MDSDESLLPDWWRLDEEPPRVKFHSTLQEALWDKSLIKASRIVENLVVQQFKEDEKSGADTPFYILAPSPNTSGWVLVASDYRGVYVEASLLVVDGSLRRSELALLEGLGFGLDFESQMAYFKVWLGKGDPESGWRLAARVALIVTWHIYRHRFDEFDGDDWRLYEAGESSPVPDESARGVDIAVVREKAQNFFEATGREVLFVMPSGDSAEWCAVLRTGYSTKKFIKVWRKTATMTADETTRKVEKWIQKRDDPNLWEWSFWE
ncbi:hypothetical protein [Sanguibacter gelidistatuariae]|nr:hypothetical protein [Sanguibacter gelidistatuariae]